MSRCGPTAASRQYSIALSDGEPVSTSPDDASPENIVPEPILTLTDAVVAFDALRAVDGVSLSVPRGQRRAIIGPNGAGKTTLFNAIAGMVPPTSGRIMFDGHDITKLPPHRRAQLGISRTFQITNLFPTLNVQDNMVLALRGLSSRKFSLFGRPDTDSVEAPGSPPRSARPALRNVPMSQSRNCPMANSASSRSRSRSLPPRQCCCSMSRPPACRHRSAQWSRRSSARWIAMSPWC